MYHFLRFPKTTQEKRANGKRCSNNKEYKIRAKRSSRQLPDAYDDLFGHRDKCWKSRRKTQYK